MPRGPKKQRLNIFLMKPGTDRQSVIRAEKRDGLSSFQISSGMEFEGEIYTKSSPANPPNWQRFVQNGTSQPLPNLLTQSASCLVVISKNGHVFAIAFGSSRYWLDEALFVRRFGMIVTLNTVHPDHIKSVDREEFEAIQRKTRSQTSISTSMDKFGLDVQRDLLRSVTGQPIDQSFASNVTGADNLIISAPIQFSELGEKCLEAFSFSQQETYKERYPWVDNFTRVTDSVRIDQLDQQLIETLKSGGVGHIFLTPPDTLDTQEHRGFKYPNQRSQDLHSDLRLEEFLSRTDNIETLTIDDLKRLRIREYTSDDNSETRSFLVYDAILYEVNEGQKLYVLSRSEWFEIDQDYVASVNQEIALIPDHDQLELIEAANGEHEGDYNRRAATASSGRLAHFDAATISYGGGHSSIEVCDLLSLDKNFIHVKAKTKSSVLSHLFAQGLNSAQAFRDARFRSKAMEICPATHSGIFLGEPRTTDHTVTYAIITTTPGDIREALPFFSKQSLANAQRELVNMGYQVRLKKIPVTTS